MLKPGSDKSWVQFLQGWIVLFLVGLGLLSALAHAQEDPDSFKQYNSIVSDLKSSLGEQPQDLSLDNRPRLHAGVAIAGSYLSIVTPNGSRVSGLLKGFEGHIGMDLLSSDMTLEGSLRIYAAEDLSSRLTADMKEADIKLVYNMHMLNQNSLRIGGGFSTRFLSLKGFAYGSDTTVNDTSPSLMLLIGYQKRLSPNLSVGPDLSYRTALSTDSVAKTTVDGTLRMNATF